MLSIAEVIFQLRLPGSSVHFDEAGWAKEPNARSSLILFNANNGFENAFAGLLWGSLLGKKGLAAICSADVPWPCPSCVRLAPALCPPWGPSLVRHVSALAVPPNLAFAMSAMCPLLVFFLSSLCRPLSGSMLWLWLGLCQLCVLSLVFAPVSVLRLLLSALVEVFVQGLPLPMVTLSRHCFCLP